MLSSNGGNNNIPPDHKSISLKMPTTRRLPFLNETSTYSKKGKNTNKTNIDNIPI